MFHKLRFADIKGILRFIQILIVLLIVIFSKLFFSGVTDPPDPNATLAGVIRWDGQVGAANSPVTAEEERALGPSQFSHRLPFYATKPTPDTCTLSCTTQAIVDQEIAFAKEAGIDYWAFCWYGNSETDGTRNMSIPRNLYLSSMHKNDVKWCPILFTHPLVTSEEDWLIARMGESNYQTVLGGRPLIYCFNYADLADPAQITRLRQKCGAAGLPDPYIVALDFSDSAAVAFANQIGADAISCYATGASNGQAYSSLASGERKNWDAYKNNRANKKVIPWVTVGWDARPRDLCEPDYIYAPNEQGFCSPDATPSEISNQLKSAINWNVKNSSAAEANAVLIYSWNEFSEGGVTVCPKMNGDRSTLDAIKNVLMGQGVEVVDTLMFIP